MGKTITHLPPSTRRGRRLNANFVLVLWAALVCAPLASSYAVPLIGTDGTKLYKFDSATPGTVTTVTITGLIGADTLVGIDYQPSTTQLYGIGNGFIYLLNPVTGVASTVKFMVPQFALSGGTFGTDISPLDDGVVRIVSNTHQNIRVKLSDGTVAATDANLTYSGTPSNIAAISYSNGFPFATTTTCFGIGATDGRLLRIGADNSSPAGAENGVVTKLGSLGLGTGLNQNIGFDIGPNGVGYAAIVFGGDLRLYTIHLSTGAASLVGSIGGAATSLRGLAAETGPKPFNNTTPILLPRPITMGELQTENADPYPSAISVSGLTGVVTRLRLFINDYRHRRPEDTSMLLVSPDGARKFVMWGGIGDSFSTCGNLCDNNQQAGTTGRFIVLDDFAGGFLPDESPLGNEYAKPTRYSGGGFFLPPAPGSGYSFAPPNGNASFNSVFYGAPPNGSWSLYAKDLISDFAGEPTGRIASGWGLEITTGPACTISCSDLTRSSMPGMCGAMVNYPVPNVAGACGTLTYSIPSGSVFPVGITSVDVTSTFGQKCSFNVNVMDFETPIISCNQDITVQAAPGASSAVVTYSGPTASDNCSGVVATYDPPSGSSFPLGTTTVKGKATDTSQSSVTCTFKVNVLANNVTPTPTPTATPLAAGTKLANISTRLRVETGNNVLIGGFIITGAEAKKVIVRALGPSIPVPGVLADPLLQVFDSNGVIASNDNWQDAANKQEIIDSGVAPSNNLESAFLGSLNPGAYTAVVSGVGGLTGVGLVEVYDLNLNANAKLANISTRGLVQTGDDVLIAGTIVLGQATQKVIVRAIGPSLNLAGQLENPTLELRDSNGGLLEANDNWVDSANKQAIIDSTVPPTNNLESAVVATLPANGASYTAIVRGVNNTGGIAVVEVYALN